MSVENNGTGTRATFFGIPCDGCTQRRDILLKGTNDLILIGTLALLIGVVFLSKKTNIVES